MKLFHSISTKNESKVESQTFLKKNNACNKINSKSSPTLVDFTKLLHWSRMNSASSVKNALLRSDLIVLPMMIKFASKTKPSLLETGVTLRRRSHLVSALMDPTSENNSFDEIFVRISTNRSNNSVESKSFAIKPCVFRARPTMRAQQVSKSSSSSSNTLDETIFEY